MDQYKPDVASTTLWPGDTRLNSKYTFETFVIGLSDRFAHAAAVAVSAAPAKTLRIGAEGQVRQFGRVHE